ncbi:hypothetical protein Y032_0003g1240 [Ancylostoma ceylanicum]|uniref:MYND-type domain-containing protein n=1 Tax=Ancylostoma ceylanicum TaxID=53326 RepID=A0A016VWJ5_9BILA|nr:hypothetical protein Y032_0003g1240 [Ancylostoma ceylanicum]
MQRNAHDLPVYLGFGNALKLDDLYRLRSIFLPLGKIGGKPSWLNPKFLPTSTQLQCPVCQKQMCFLIQVYATSENDPPHSFHRTLFIFICRNPHCSRPNDPSNMTVFRCCLPRLNPYYSFDGPMDPDLDGDVPDPRLPEDAPELCEVCGCHASKKCGKCGTAWYCCRDHQALDWTTRHKQCCGNVPDPVAPPPLTNPLNKFLFKEYGIEMDQENKGVLHGSVTCPVITNDRLVRKCVTIWGRSLTGLAVGRRKSGKIDSELEFASEALPPVRSVECALLSLQIRPKKSEKKKKNFKFHFSASFFYIHYQSCTYLHANKSPLSYQAQLFCVDPPPSGRRSRFGRQPSLRDLRFSRATFTFEDPCSPIIHLWWGAR